MEFHQVQRNIYSSQTERENIIKESQLEMLGKASSKKMGRYIRAKKKCQKD
jgi:hypothetical protein